MQWSNVKRNYFICLEIQKQQIRETKVLCGKICHFMVQNNMRSQLLCNNTWKYIKMVEKKNHKILMLWKKKSFSERVERKHQNWCRIFLREHKLYPKLKVYTNSGMNMILFCCYHSFFRHPFKNLIFHFPFVLLLFLFLFYYTHIISHFVWIQIFIFIIVMSTNIIIQQFLWIFIFFEDKRIQFFFYLLISFILSIGFPFSCENIIILFYFILFFRCCWAGKVFIQ